ncbi:MAG: chromosome segregation protein SMC [Bacilli bacterium]|nr:chromosome segregation protein SMC [Bacilli bacterium]
MYLKEISASGFKSFAEKLTISLDGKTTCIVGPNGSGKSNIVDAVRWVLGEQSVKSLRGDSGMTDVIFSGSKSRNPLNVASVSLTFDNSDNYLKIPYNEVSIKRRVYRTGENEYYLNGDKCRLKDITDLFIDSGIGKDAFNIISQGDISKILSNSPEERRTIFESAAGVLKYKKRKEEAIRKLDRTHNNLDRVNDIIGELEVQVEPLKEQSKKALEYLENKEKLENIEVALIAYEIEEMNFQYEEVKKNVEELNNKILNLNVKGNNDDTLFIESKNDLGKLNVELNEFNNRLLELTKKEEKLNGEMNILKERSKYDASNSKVHENISKLKEDKLKLENDLYLLNKDIEDLLNEVNNNRDEVSKIELEVSNLKKRKDSSLSDLDNKNRELTNVSHKIEVLNNYISSGGSLSNSVKSVLNNPRLSGIHDVLGNLIEVDEKYTKALEVALLASKQYIVVDDEKSAKSAINYLKDNNLGRATFFPIAVIKPRGIDHETLSLLSNEDGFIDIFSNVVTYSDKYYGVVTNQLGNVILVNNIDTANRVSKRINQRYKIVTLDGDVVNVGGSITGGSLHVGKSIISEKKELEYLNRHKKELEVVITDINKDIVRFNDEISKLEEVLFSNKSKLVEIEEILHNKENNNSILRSSLENTDNELNSLGHVVDSSLSKEEERLMNEYYSVNREKEELIKDINNKAKEKDKLSMKIDEMEAINKMNNSLLYKTEKELKEQEILLGKLDVKLDNHLNILREDYELTFEKAKDNYVLELEPSEARTNVNIYKNNIKRLGMVNLASIEDYKRVSERYEFLTSQKNDLLNAKETLLEIIEEMDSVMKEEFLTTFEKIEIEFKKVFKELFHGGTATLKLTDPNNILETGIEIIASPPGKKLASISLLSGGEKTLTAISLIFAILNVRVVPFCLFDEVEAALDEANVDNFGKYLNNYSNKTQFLLITHKKKTMEYANTLYGITMQESGVSKLVSVKLDKID